MLGELSVPSVPLSKPPFSRASPALAVSRWSLDASGEKSLFFWEPGTTPISLFPSFMSVFFPDPFLHHVSSTGWSTGHTLWGPSAHSQGPHWKECTAWWYHGWWHELQANRTPQQFLVYLLAWWLLCILVSPAHSHLELEHSTYIKANDPFLLLVAFLITHISFSWGVWSSPDLISIQGSNGCFGCAVFEQK